jgi:alkylhydroperoxidase family enzyme
MARVPLVDPEGPGTDPEVTRLLHEHLASVGSASVDDLHNIARAMANNVEALGILQATTRLFRSGRLSPAQRELAYLTASVLNACHY